MLGSLMRASAATFLLMLGACSRDVATGTRCAPGRAQCAAAGQHGDAGSASFGNGAGASGGAGVASSSNDLSVHIEDIHAMTLEVITVACAGDCADVLAVAHGGHPPYAFRWDDGSTRAQRRVCPEAAATYGVDATDSAVTSDEFHYDAHTVHAELGATVSSCSGDGGVPSGDALCVTNPSFEGTPQVNLGTAASFDASPWHGCAASGGTPDIIAQNTLPFALGATFPAPTDGATYLRMACALGGSGSPDVHEMTTQQLCAPLLAGHTYSFLIDAMASHEQPAGSLAKLVVRGASSDCGDGEPLWASPPLAADWTTLCVTLRPADDTPYLTLYPDGDVSMGATLLVDNLRPVVACP